MGTGGTSHPRKHVTFWWRRYVLKGHTPQPWLKIPSSQPWGHLVQGGMARLRRHGNEC